MNDNYTNSNKVNVGRGVISLGHVGVCNTVEHWRGNVQEATRKSGL